MYPILMDTISKRIISMITISNVLDLYEKINCYEIKCLDEAIVTLVQSCTLQVLNEKSFVNVKALTVKFILSQPKLNASEPELLNACIRWAVAECVRQNLPDQPSVQRKVLGNLIHLIRLPCFRLNDFSTFLSLNGFFSQDEKADLFTFFCSPQRSMEGFLSHFECKPRHNNELSWVNLNMPGEQSEGSTANFTANIEFEFSKNVYMYAIRFEHQSDCGLLNCTNQLTIRSNLTVLHSEKNVKFWSTKEDLCTVQHSFSSPVFIGEGKHCLLLDMSCGCDCFEDDHTENEEFHMNDATLQYSLEVTYKNIPGCINKFELCIN